MKTDKLKSIEIFAIIIGAIIGMGSFMLPGSKFLPSAGVINTTIGLFAGTMMIVVIERSYRYMMSKNITEGGEFSYTLMNFGKKHAFVVGWYLFLAYLTLIPLNALAMPIVINYLFPDLLSFGYLYTIAGNPLFLGEVLVSSAVCIVFAFVNLVGVKSTGRIQTYIIYVLIASVIIVLIGMLYTANMPEVTVNYVDNYRFSLSEISKIFVATPFLFIGFDAIPQLVNDLGVSKRKASTMSIIALLIGMLLYMILNFSTALAFSADEAVSYEWALGAGVMQHMGIVGFFILVIGLGCAATAGINGFMLCSTKLIGAMAKEKVMPPAFGAYNKHGVGKNTVYFVTIMGIALSFFERDVVVWIVDMCSFGAALAYFYVCLATALKGEGLANKIYAWIGVAFSMFIGVLLLVPFSPARLSLPPLIMLAVWTVAGLIIGIRLFKKER